MNYKGHIVFGFVFLLFIYLVNLKYQFLKLTLTHELLLYIPLFLFMSLLPDIDHDSSKPRWVVMFFGLIIALYFIFTGKSTSGGIIIGALILLMILKYFPGWQHRGHAHSLLFILLVSVGLAFFIENLTIILLAFLCALSHLIADCWGSRTNPMKLW